MTTPAEIRAAALAASASAPALRAMSPAKRGELLATAAGCLADRGTDAGTAIRQTLAAETGLSAEMVDWGLKTTLDEVSLAAVERLCEDADGTPIGLVSVVLAGNIFSASVRACWVPLALGVPVVAKHASGQAAMPLALAHAWQCTAPRLAADALQIASFERGDAEHEGALFTHAEAVSVYGSDDTVAKLGARSGLPIIAHGHGIGAAFVDQDSIATDLRNVTKHLALDVAAYDQRGCLSPHAIFAQTSEPLGFAQALGEALQAIAAELPVGAVPLEARAELAQWRGVGEATAKLIQNDAGALALRPSIDDYPLRPTPGYRHVDIYLCASFDEAVARLSTLGAHLKCFGVPSGRLAEAKSAFAAVKTPPRICALGSMQRPAFDAWSDGYPAWRGLVRRR